MAKKIMLFIFIVAMAYSCGNSSSSNSLATFDAPIPNPITEKNLDCTADSDCTFVIYDGYCPSICLDCINYNFSDYEIVAVNIYWEPHCISTRPPEISCAACIGTIQGYEDNSIACENQVCVKKITN